MDLQKSANLFIYRIREKGLEIFLKNDGEQWELPQHPVAKEKAVALEADDRLIALDPVEADGSLEDGIAMEGDWHDIPSLKSLLIQDVKFMKNEVKPQASMHKPQNMQRPRSIRPETIWSSAG